MGAQEFRWTKQDVSLSEALLCAQRKAREVARAAGSPFVRARIRRRSVPPERRRINCDPQKPANMIALALHTKV